MERARWFASYTHELAADRQIVIDGGYSWQDDVLSLAGARGNSLTLPSYGRAKLIASYRW